MALPHPDDIRAVTAANRGGYTLDNHPNRDVKPDEWMLRNARQTMSNIAPLYAQLDLNGKAPRK